MHWALELVIDSAKEAVLFGVITGAVSLAVAVFLGVPFGDAFGLILLLIGTGLMLIGGALEFSSTASARILGRQVRLLFGRTVDRSPEWSNEDYKKAQQAAARYSLTGVILFLAAFTLAILT